MSWDLKLDSNRDLTNGTVSGIDEMTQRLLTRLNREKGEWFLNTEAGLAMYQEGLGLLGSKSKRIIDLYLRKEILETDGVNRIISFNSIYKTESRSYYLYVELITEYGAIQLNISTSEGEEWTME